MKGKREADNNFNFNFKSEKLDELRSRVDAAFDEHGDEAWEQMFAANPEGRQCLVPLGGWRYRAYGRVVGVQPVVVDCGVLQVEDVVNSQDPALLGATLAFTIARLDAYMAGT